MSVRGFRGATLIITLPLVGVIGAPLFAQEGAGQATDEPARFFLDRVPLAAEEYLDLDTGGVFRARRSPSGAQCEVRARGEEIEFLVERVLDPEPGEMAPDLGPEPWYRLTTDRGRTAWVQLLSSGHVRVLTRQAGTGPLRPMPGGAFCLGRGDRIEVHFDLQPEFARYRIERRIGVDGSFEGRGDLGEPPFMDADVQVGERYGYRIVGLTEGGDEGIPAEVQGTTVSRGLVRGVCRLDSAGRSFDFLTEVVLERDGDITLTGTYGGNSAASFADGWGAPVESFEEVYTRRTDAGANGGWVTRARGQLQIRPGSYMLVPLRGGGVAHCRVTMPADSWTVELEYQVNPDGNQLPPVPPLELLEEGERVLLSVDAPEGVVIERALRRDLLRDGGVELEVEGTKAADPDPLKEGLAEYEVSLMDRHGRSIGTVSEVLDSQPRGVRRGRFRFHYEQSYSLERQRLVERDVGDVTFSSAAGGITSITLSARGGIANDLLDRESAEGLLPADLFRAVVSASPAGLSLDQSAGADSRRPESEVFVLRTRHGGWARLAIVGREDGPGWDKSHATVLFAYNPHEPVFDEVVEERMAVGGVILDSVRLYGIGFEQFDPGILMRGELELTLGQGVDLEAGELAEGERADVVFAAAEGAGILASARTPRRGASLFLPQFGELRPDEGALFEHLAFVGAHALSLQNQVSLLRDTPAGRVLFLRTSEGAWAKLAISDVPGDEERLRVRWCVNPAGPVFALRPEDAEESLGYVLDRVGLLGIDPDPYRFDALQEGTLRLGRGEGWSFAKGSVVPAREADLALVRATADWVAVDLRAPRGGLVSLASLEEWKGRPRTVEELFEAVVGVRPEAVRLAPDLCVVSHEPASDVFVLRTADGGWACAMVDSRPRRGAADAALELRYRYCPGTPGFRSRPGRLVSYGGLLLEPLH